MLLPLIWNETPSEENPEIAAKFENYLAILRNNECVAETMTDEQHEQFTSAALVAVGLNSDQALAMIFRRAKPRVEVVLMN